MRCGDYADALLDHHLFEQPEYGVRVVGVQLAGGFVRQDERGAYDDGARYGYALLLAAR